MQMYFGGFSGDTNLKEKKLKKLKFQNGPLK